MLRALVLATLLTALPAASAVQQPSVLGIKVVVKDADGRATPVPRYLLLVSENPPAAPPRRVMTALDGTATVRLRPGNYTIESDQPFAFQGKLYSWIQTLDIVSGREAVLELTADNADVESGDAATGKSSVETESAMLQARWQDSVVSIWTPTAHGSGFSIGANGLIATSQRIVGNATAIEVQLSSTLKVAANVVGTDAERGMALLSIDPKTAAAVQPVPLGCGQAQEPAADRKVITIGSTRHQLKRMTSGTMSGRAAHLISSDLDDRSGPRGRSGVLSRRPSGRTDHARAGGNRRGRARRPDRRPVRARGVCGGEAEGRRRAEWNASSRGTGAAVSGRRAQGARHSHHRQADRVSHDVDRLRRGVHHACDGLCRAQSVRRTAAPPVERRRARSGAGCHRPARGFQQLVRLRGRRSARPADSGDAEAGRGVLDEVARGAASTQGMSLPPIKRFKSGFARLRAFCGDAEVLPVHPFRLAQRVSETDAIYEGLYAFDPGALAPSCGSVKLTFYSEKAPEAGDSKVVDPKVVQQIWDDFEPYRTDR